MLRVLFQRVLKGERNDVLLGHGVRCCAFQCRWRLAISAGLKWQ
jgi:hypothetical protein